MPFSEKQNEYFEKANHRWNFKVGATRSGKTYADYYVIPKRIRRVIGQEGLTIILGVSKATIERNVLEPMRQLWGDGMVGRISSDNTCFLFGERVYCLGAEKVSQVSKLRGSSIKYAYGDEVADWNSEVFALLKSRLDKTYSHFDGALNPQSPNHWLKEFLDSDADIYAQHYTIFDNPFLPKEFVDNLCKEYAGTVYYKRYILGEWALAEGLIYPMYEECIEEPLEATQIASISEWVLSIDYGTQNAFAALLWGLKDGVWHCVREYYYSGRDTGQQKTDEEYLGDINEFVGDLTELETIIDPSAASMIALLRKQDGKYRVRKADNDVKNGINETASAMRRGLIKVSRACKNGVHELQGYVWDDKALDDVPVKINDHFCDALRYFVKTKRVVKVETQYKSIFGR